MRPLPAPTGSAFETSRVAELPGHSARAPLLQAQELVLLASGHRPSGCVSGPEALFDFFSPSFSSSSFCSTSRAPSSALSSNLKCAGARPRPWPGQRGGRGDRGCRGVKTVSRWPRVALDKAGSGPALAPGSWQGPGALGRVEEPCRELAGIRRRSAGSPASPVRRAQQHLREPTGLRVSRDHPCWGRTALPAQPGSPVSSADSCRQHVICSGAVLLIRFQAPPRQEAAPWQPQCEDS